MLIVILLVDRPTNLTLHNKRTRIDDKTPGEINFTSYF